MPPFADGQPPQIWTPPKPAIIRALPPTFRVRIGEQYGAEAVEYHEWSFPRDIREATLEEALVYLPEHLRKQFPWWALERMLPLSAMLPGMVPIIAGSGLTKTVVFLTTTSGSNQTWDVLADWNSADNLVEVIASGGSGGARRGANNTNEAALATGGSGAGYSAQTNVALTPSGSMTYRLPAGGASAAATSSNTTVAGNNGADAWANGTTLAGSSVGAKGGLGGTAGTVAQSAIPGGAAADGVGNTKTNGGGAGSVALGASTNIRASGGGGAGGPTSDGGTSGDSPGAGIRTGGGDGGSPDGGTGSAGSTGSTSAGGDGTTWQSSPARGSGGGSGGSAASTDAALSSGAAGNFGAASGGAATRNPSGNTGNATSGVGGPALIVITNNASL